MPQYPEHLSPLQVKKVSLQGSVPEMFSLEGMGMFCVDAEGTNGREGLHKQHILVAPGRTSQQDPSTSEGTLDRTQRPVSKPW